MSHVLSPGGVLCPKPEGPAKRWIDREGHLLQKAGTRGAEHFFLVPQTNRNLTKGLYFVCIETVFAF